jgi:hypothetical protein
LCTIFLHVLYIFQFHENPATPVKLETVMRTPITVQTVSNQLTVISPNGQAHVLRSLVGNDGVIHVIDGVI